MRGVQKCVCALSRLPLYGHIQVIPKNRFVCRCGGQVVSVLDFYSYPAEVYNFYCLKLA